MSRHEDIDTLIGKRGVVGNISSDAEVVADDGVSPPIWRVLAASAGDAALRVLLTLAFALLVVVVMGQVSGQPAEAAALGASSVATSDVADMASWQTIPIALSHPPTSAGDLASLRRGATMFATYCLSCHSASRVRFGQLRDLGFSDAAIAADLNPGGAPLSSAMHAAMPADTAEKAFGRAPPDLSLVANEKGAAWLYTYLRSFYMDPTARMGANNVLVPGVVMPDVLAGLHGARTAVFAPESENASNTPKRARKFVRFEPLAPGSLSPSAYGQAIAELVAYMAWMADPHSVERHRLGGWVVGFLVLFGLSAWGLMRAYWRRKN